ncbi:proteasome subunit alpha [Candidatus Nitronereus thalassa]|uniref:Proteasome subunit alpha n=1 Tax=Candidatus Nitronereus thalassa TaxID=3020898 RepID=A0ABU3K3E1_9BACT|nr:proteasome subunit alpha [Candidatus Nitronereus thalassa]MDT7040917.1 proteasome subunit alpha [Candidatus Nitronereus thalassa]
MSIPYYVSPEQLMQDKAEYAKKGIAKGRSIIAIEYQDGVLFVADNPSTSLFKVSEIYDNIAFSGAGKYSEFENLRKAGIQHADLKGFMYSREDVTARSLANGYSQTLGTIFSQELKPFEVEILLAQVGEQPGENELFRIAFDGTIFHERSFVAIGGRSESLLLALQKKSGDQLMNAQAALKHCVGALTKVSEQAVAPDGLEVATLDRNRVGRKFRRFPQEELSSLLS